MEDTTRELAVQALNDLLKTMSHYAKERPHDPEVITALSTGIAAVLPIALEASKEVAGFVVNTKNQPRDCVDALIKEAEHYRNAKSQSL